ncbi:MAG: sulfite exporter TauE/SafE family protein [Proteobacteria bacterium]|nr:sulfite exporter TauE/SafE family protein [Burkholderiales bacterium]
MSVDLPLALWVAIFAVVAVAGLLQGAIGFGFPVVATPLLAMLMDIRTAIVVTVIPNMITGLFAIVRGGNFDASLGRYWPVAAWTIPGALIGTQILIVAPQDWLKLFLAIALFVYLRQEALNRVDWTTVRTHPKTSGAVAGFLGGFLSGSVNVALPPLLIYFSALSLSTLAMTQIMNLCFLSARMIQTGALALAGQLDRTALLVSLPLTGIALATMWAGWRIQDRVDAKTYKKMLRVFLWVMAIGLAVQSGWRLFLT